MNFYGLIKKKAVGEISDYPGLGYRGSLERIIADEIVFLKIDPKDR